MGDGEGTNTSAVWDGERKIDLVHREEPAPGADELKIRVEASGLCGTDLHIASGEYPLALPGVVIGHEFAGTIVEAGPDVAESLAVGGRIVVDPNIPCRTCSYCHNARPHLCENPEGIGVTRNGGLAEFAIVPAAQAYRVPEGLPAEVAALAEPLACALHAVDLAELQPGATALVLGAGPIGVLCAALLVTVGASRVVVSEPHPDRRDCVRDFGAEPVEPEAVSGGEADVVLECVGRVGTMKAAVKSARPGGRWYGSGWPRRRTRSGSNQDKAAFEGPGSVTVDDRGPDRGHAVVIGGSMAGLLAARVLSEHFRRVTVVERDRFPNGIEDRRGVPQGPYAHGLTARGKTALEGMFPGITGELIADGAIAMGATSESHWYQPSGYRAHFESGLVVLMMSRPLLEGCVRRRVGGLENVSILPGRAVAGLTATPDCGRVALRPDGGHGEQTTLADKQATR